MDTRTGAIAQFESDADAKRAGYDRKLTAAEVQQLSGMTRKQRREWARKNGNGAARTIDRLERENRALLELLKLTERRLTPEERIAIQGNVEELERILKGEKLPW